MSSNVNISVSGLVAAILLHGCITSDPLQPVRMSDTTYVIRWRNVTQLCDVKKTPACSDIVTDYPSKP